MPTIRISADGKEIQHLKGVCTDLTGVTYHTQRVTRIENHDGTFYMVPAVSSLEGELPLEFNSSDRQEVIEEEVRVINEVLKKKPIL